MKSRRVIIYDKEDVRVEQQELEPLPQDCVRIETEYSLISAGTELSRVFKLKEGATYPVYPGYSAVGRITESNIKGFSPGDRVLFSGTHSSHHNFNPANSDGSILFKLKEETDPEKATYISMGWIAMNAILPVDVKLGDTVAIFGLGTLGTFAALYYQLMGTRVICFEPNENRAATAAKAGVREIVTCDPREQVSEFFRLVPGDGADIAVDAAGISACIETAIQVTGKYGQVVLLGSPRQPLQDNVSVPFYSIHSKDLKVIGALNRLYEFDMTPGSRRYKKRYLELIENLINEGKLPVELFISHEVSPDAAELLEAYRGLMYRQEEYTGVVIKWK